MSIRRVRFAQDYDTPSSPSDQDTLALPRLARSSQTSSKHTHTEFVEHQREEYIAHETSRTEHLENVRLAAQRAHDAMMLARSMQADIRSSNAKFQRYGHGVKSQGAPLSPRKPSAAQLITSTEKHANPLPDDWKEHDIISVPMAWINDVFQLMK